MPSQLRNLKKLNNLVLTLAKVMEDLGYELVDSVIGSSQNETTAREDRNADKKEITNDLKKAEIHIFAECRKMVKGNLTSLLGCHPQTVYPFPEGRSTCYGRIQK